MSANSHAAMPISRPLLVLALAAVVGCWADSVAAVTIKIDYSDDEASTGNKFFGSSNPQGPTGATQARAALQAAAGFFSNLLEDTLSAIVVPPTFTSPRGSSVTWHWSAKYFGSHDSHIHTKTNLPVGTDEYIIFVGARNLDGNDVGSGAPGWAETGAFGSYHPADGTQVNQITTDFNDLVHTRGETGGFVSWGGSIAFDVDTNWHFNHNTPPAATQDDFYSVAIHEMAHALGFGSFSAQGATPWSMLVNTNNNTFTGSNAQARYGGPVPLESASDRSHWKNETQSKVIGTGTSHETSMDPSITTGDRKLFTELDAAALVDIGWEISLPEMVPGDYNGNGVVDAADYIVWRNTLGSTSNLQANGDNTGASANRIDQADYTFWRARFGRTSGSGSEAVWTSGLANVPEPTAITLFFMGAVAIFLSDSRLNRRSRRR